METCNSFSQNNLVTSLKVMYNDQNSELISHFMDNSPYETVYLEEIFILDYNDLLYLISETHVTTIT
jgi:hypothetical protein